MAATVISADGRFEWDIEKDDKNDKEAYDDYVKKFIY